MNPFVTYLFQTVIAVSIFYLIYWLLLKKETFFRFNRYYFLVTAVIALIIPILDIGNISFFAESEPVKTISTGYVSMQNSVLPDAVVIPIETNGKPGFLEFLGIGYLIGVAYLLMRLLFQSILLFLKIRQDKIIRMFGSQIVLDKKVRSAFSFFSWIFLNPTQIEEPNLSDIILHEKEHIRQKHSYDLFFIELLCAFQWINPFAWLLRKSIKETHEYLADNAVLIHGTPVDDYQKLLLSQALGIGYPALITPFNYSLNKNRMIMMKKLKSPGTRKWRSLLLLPVILFLGLAFSNPFSNNRTESLPVQNDSQSILDSIVIADNTQKPLLYILDGKEVAINEITSNPPEMLLTFTVLKGKEAVKIYGEKARNGVVVIESTDILYVLDGKEISENEYKSLKSEMLLSYKILKGEEAVEAYGEKARKGVIVVKSVDLSNESNLQKYEITGKILDAPNGEPIPAANIVILNENIGTITDDQGNFKLELPNESAQIAISMLGFEEVTREVKSGDDMEIRLNKLAIGSLAVPVEKFTSPYIQKYELTGKVILAGSDEPIPGVSIVISNTHSGTVSDMQGNFKLQLPEETVQVVFSFVGLGTVKREVKDGDKLVIKLKKAVATLNLDSPEVIHVKEVEKEEPVADEKSSTEIFYVVEDMPHFPGGKAKLSEYISSNIKYPKNARKSKIEGTVPVNFTVDTKGYIKNVFVAKGKGIDPELDKEAIRVISEMPKWDPGTQRGKKVPVDLSVPVKFSL